MGVEFVLRGPLPARHADRQFVQRRRDRAAETDIGADPLHQVAQVGAAQQRIERALQAGAARPGLDRVGRRRCSGVMVSGVSSAKRRSVIGRVPLQDSGHHACVRPPSTTISAPVM